MNGLVDDVGSPAALSVAIGHEATHLAISGIAPATAATRRPMPSSPIMICRVRSLVGCHECRVGSSAVFLSWCSDMRLRTSARP